MNTRIVWTHTLCRTQVDKIRQLYCNCIVCAYVYNSAGR